MDFQYVELSSLLRQVRVEGVTRASEARGGFVPDNAPGVGPADPAAHWYWLEAPALARAAGLPPDTPLIEAVTDAHPRWDTRVVADSLPVHGR
jgi:cytochrome oxidase assembly protein ShyY1